MKQELENAMKQNDKAKAADVALQALEGGMDLVELYSGVLAPMLNAIDCAEDDFECVWLEHQMTSITRTIVEMGYAYVLKRRRVPEESKHVLIACPREEYHELGAIMGGQFLELAGFKTTYIGANTPLETIDAALRTLEVDFLALSVSNAYHLFEVRHIIAHIRNEHPHVRIIGAGRGFENHEAAFRSSIAYLITSYASVEEMAEAEGLACSH